MGPENDKNVWRKSEQYLMPVRKPERKTYSYDIYPALEIGENRIFEGTESLAAEIALHKIIIIDGYNGILFDIIKDELENILGGKGLKTCWISTSDFLRQSDVTDKITAPFTGGDDPLFGTRTTLVLEDFFDIKGLRETKPDPESDISIIIGPGAAMAGWKGLLIYFDLPKNEMQFRSRAGSIKHLGASAPADPKETYKRFYFVDWIVLNKHKKKILPGIDIFADGQRAGNPVWIKGKILRDSLKVMSHNFFRVRPWFEPGAWGGSWIMKNIKGLNKEVPNYAWSFELITPENGLLIESSSLLLEVSFESLMYLEGEAVLGRAFQRFGHEFPIRFDFLDTFDGGNLSLQCHPRPEYTRKNFGEEFTQEETYYILDTKDDAVVYLGFREDIDPEAFRKDLERSFNEKKPVEPEKYIQKHPAAKHDLFLIPYGTIHGSGSNNIVLEISSTPYIFTFKMYDWLRLDLDGKPRTLNINRGMENLFFDCKGSYVRSKLIATPRLVQEGPDWQLWHLPTHETHLYDVRRFHFQSSVEVHTDNKCLVMSLVEGQSVEVESINGLKQIFSYAETFVIPAAAGVVEIRNRSAGKAIIVYAYVK